jgi:Putative auto-transporter adhesin, head GIN domain
MIRLLALLALLLPAPAFAIQRTYSVGSFDRVRVEGPFEVRIRTGTSPGAAAQGDRKLIEQLDITVNGTTLVVRLGNEGWGETPRDAPTTPPVVTLTTPRLTSIVVNAGGRVTVAPLSAQRVDVSVTGAGAIVATGIQADQFNAAVIGNGSLVLAGKVQRARLSANGAGAIDASGMIANDLVVRLDGPGEISGNARFTAQVNSTGLGKVTIGGAAKCTVRASAGGPVVCGTKASN